MESELSELRAELWRTRGDLERMKTRTPPGAAHSPRHTLDRRRHDAGSEMGDNPGHHGHSSWRKEQDGSEGAKSDHGGVGGGIGSGPTSPPTSGEMSGSFDKNDSITRRLDGSGKRESRRSRDRHRRGSDFGQGDTAAAEEALSDLQLEGVASKNWTEEASSIAVRLIEEVKTLRWERTTWAEREAIAERSSVEMRERAEALEARLRTVENDRKRSLEALSQAQQAEKKQLRAAEAAKAELRAAQEREREITGQMISAQGRGVTGHGGGSGLGLREELRREKEGADALQRRLDVARAAAARHDRERKDWLASRARLEELRRSWGKQLKKVEKKMRSMAKDNASLRAHAAQAEEARALATADASRLRDDLRRLTEQRDTLLLGATRAGHLSASSPADALVELLAAAAAGVVAGASSGAADGGRGDGARGYGKPVASMETGAMGLGNAPRNNQYIGGGGGGIGVREGMSTNLVVELERARAEAKAAKEAAEQERLQREGAARDKDEAVRQLHRLMGAARRAVGRRDSRLKSSRLETEVVWNALTKAVR